jgi:hypothetical protein
LPNEEYILGFLKNHELTSYIDFSFNDFKSFEYNEKTTDLYLYFNDSVDFEGEIGIFINFNDDEVSFISEEH